MRKLIPLAVAATALISTSLALAASSPTVSTSAPTAVTDTGATLNGTVNPDGAATTYIFDWGTTSALGNYAPSSPASAGAGTKGVAETAALTNLQPGSTYYFQLQATNSAGTADSPIKTFKTTGTPPPGPTTGTASAIGRYVATLTGTIAPNNSTTTYYFQYGLSTNYGLQTSPLTVPAGTAIVSVTTPLLGLEPGVTFHYRLVTAHADGSTTYGSDETFETFPDPRPQTAFVTNVFPRSAAKVPLTIHVNGRIGVPVGTPETIACGGKVKVAILDGTRVLARGTASVQSNCQYFASARLTRIPGARPGHSTRLAVTSSYGGDSWIDSSTLRRTFVTVR